MSNLRLKLTLELVWWIATAILVVLVLLPIFNVSKVHPFLVSNVIFIVVFVTYTRYIFLLKNTFLARIRPIKILLILISLPLMFYLISHIYDVQMFLDEHGKQAFFTSEMAREGVSAQRLEKVVNYMRSEMIFFGVASIIVAILMPIRMIMSIWRTYNTVDKV